MSSPTAASFAWFLEHGVRAALEASCDRDALAVATQALRRCLGARTGYVVVAIHHDPTGLPTSERIARVALVDGDPDQVLPTGTTLGECAESHALESWPRPARTRRIPWGDEGAVTVLGARVATRPSDAILIPFSDAVIVLLVDPDDDLDLGVADSLRVLLGAAVEQRRAREDLDIQARTLEDPLIVHRILVSGPIEDTFPRCAQYLARTLQLSSAFLAVVSRDGEGLEVVVTHGEFAPPVGMRLPLSDEPVCSPDRPPWLGPLGATLRGVHARSGGVGMFMASDVRGGFVGAVVPLAADDAVVGVLVLLQLENGADFLRRSKLDRQRRQILQAVGETLAPTLERSLRLLRQDEALREWRLLFDVVDVMVVSLDERGRILRANAQFARRFDCSPEHLVGRPIETYLPRIVLPEPTALSTPLRTTWAGPAGESLRATAWAATEEIRVVTLVDARSVAPAASTSQSYASLRRVGTGRPRILIVDDEPSILRAVSRMLARSHEVVTATDGDEALTILREAHYAFDAVMTDMQMPRIGGADLYHAIEDEAPTLAERVLFTTGGFFGPEVEGFLRSMASRVLRKPFEPEALRRAIEARINVARSRVA